MRCIVASIAAAVQLHITFELREEGEDGSN